MGLVVRGESGYEVLPGHLWARTAEQHVLDGVEVGADALQAWNVQEGSCTWRSRRGSDPERQRTVYVCWDEVRKRGRASLLMSRALRAGGWVDSQKD